MSSNAKTITSTEVYGNQVDENTWSFDVKVLGFETSDKTRAKGINIQQTSITDTFREPRVLYETTLENVTSKNYKAVVLKWLREIKQIQVYDKIHFDIYDAMNETF